MVEPEPPAAPVRAEDVPPIDEAAHVLDTPGHTEAPPALEPEPEPEAVPDAMPAAPVPPASLDTTPDLAPASVAAIVAPPHVDDDAEAAAMRAIEGSWTPRAAVVPEQPAPEPELSRAEIEAAMQSARNAVANAAAAAQAALAEAAHESATVAPAQELSFEVVDAGKDSGFLESPVVAAAPLLDGVDFEPERPVGGFGRPQALAAPREGGKDNLRQIKGITPELEHALNHAGIFHYDQVAAWDRKATVWLDHHLALRGRIGREKWIEQARALVAGRPHPPRPVRR